MASTVTRSPTGRRGLNNLSGGASIKADIQTGGRDDNSCSGSSGRGVEKVVGNIILFDGVCNFCNYWIDLLIRGALIDSHSSSPCIDDSSISCLLLFSKSILDAPTDSVPYSPKGA